MTTTKTAIKVAEAATKADDKKGLKAPNQVKEPVQLKEVLAHFSAKAELLRNRTTLVYHLDQIEDIEVKGKNEFGDSQSITSIELNGENRRSYTIKNPFLVECIKVELKSLIQTKIHEIEAELLK